MTSWYLEPVFDSYWLVAAVAVALLALLLLRPAFGRLAPRQWLVLVSLRALAVGLLFVVMLQPACVHTDTHRQAATLLLLGDVSRSMNQPQELAGQSRFAAQQKALAQLEGGLAQLAPDLEVASYVYDTELRPLEREGDAFRWPAAAQGAQTDIGTTLAEALSRERGKRLAGVLLLGDGAQTAFAPRVETVEAAREVARLGAPLYAVAFGLPRDRIQSKDVAVTSLPEQYSVFVNTELAVKALLEVRGYLNQDLPVELFLEEPGGARRSLGRKTVRAAENGQLVAVEFAFVPERVGQFQLVVEAVEQPGEATTANNQLLAYLNVLEGGVRLFYLAGSLWGEQLRLRRALDAADDMQVDFQWVDPRTRARWPIDLAEPLERGQYDIFILENVPAAALGEKQLATLARLVGQGKALLMLGGETSFGAGGYFGTPLADVLPVTFDRFEKQDIGAPVRSDLHYAGPLPLVPADEEYLTRLTPGVAAAVSWAKLPPLAGANRFVGLKPRARVILKGPREEPLLVAGEAGGRVLAFAGDSTWRWWGQGFVNEHKRFWRGAMLWLVGREEAEKNDVWLQLAARRLMLGGKLSLTCGVRSASGEPVADADLRVTVTTPQGESIPLALTPAGGERKAIFEATSRPGRYRVLARAMREGKPLGESEREFEVIDQNPEDTDPAADPEHLARLANVTREFGGRLLAPEELPGLIKLLRERPIETETEVQRKWQLAGTAGDAWALLATLVTLLGSEWYLRKKWGLV